MKNKDLPNRETRWKPLEITLLLTSKWNQYVVSSWFSHVEMVKPRPSPRLFAIYTFENPHKWFLRNFFSCIVKVQNEAKHKHTFF